MTPSRACTLSYLLQTYSLPGYLPCSLAGEQLGLGLCALALEPQLRGLSLYGGGSTMQLQHSTLEYLGFSVTAGTAAADLHIEKCTSLRRLDLCIPDLLITAATFADVLARTTAPLLVDIRIATSGYVVRWDSDSATLSTPKFGTLKRVVLRLAVDPKSLLYTLLERAIRSALSAVEERCALVLTSGRSDRFETIPSMEAKVGGSRGTRAILDRRTNNPKLAGREIDLPSPETMHDAQSSSSDAANGDGHHPQRNAVESSAVTAPASEVTFPHGCYGAQAVHIIPQLPAEVRDMVLDEVWNQGDRMGIKMCSLVCRAWVTRCRHWLFQDVKLTVPRLVDRFEQVLIGNPDIGAFVRCLHLAIPAPGWNIPLDAGQDEVIRTLTSRVPNLSRFELSRGCIIDHTTLQHLSGIHQLHLSTPEVCSWSALRSWFRSIPNLEVMELDGLHCIDDPALLGTIDGVKDVAILPQLKKLVVFAYEGWAYTMDVMDIIMSGSIKPTIKHLEISGLQVQHPHREAQWLADITPSVEFLQLHLESEFIPSIPFHAFVSCRYLHTLDLEVDCTKEVEEAFAMEVQVLSHITAPSLRILRLSHRMIYEPVKELSAEPSWKPLVAILSMSKFPTLQELRFLFYQPSFPLDFSSPPNPRSLFEEIRKALPDYSSRGVLKLPQEPEIVGDERDVIAG
ncbi:hypothetical protein CERSUDRAFT_92252 [Gelatoporia subvermispora B]|uniref:F-box domain-containing protein n=1 Tax=Ceriporiopsis subvermispora (strain B) TaxID=914234 RepID=M2R5A5_CERS8|nr:hypothetical protein CERSUDRAFT_92252 [Gelatoporia subvermispora B]